MNEGKPETSDGYTKIANEYLDALIKITLTSSERQVLDWTMRQTWGWNKKEDGISISQFVKATNLSRRTVIYAIQNLEARNMLTVSRGSATKTPGGGATKKTNIIRIQKRYKEWVVQRKATPYSKLLEQKRLKYTNLKPEVVQLQETSEKVVQPSQGVVQPEENKSHFVAPTKDTSTTKEIKTNTSTLSQDQKTQLKHLFAHPPKTLKYSPLSKEIQLAVFLIREINKSPLWTFKPKLPVMSKIIDSIPSINQTKLLQSWAHVFNLIVRVDKRTTSDIQRMMTISQSDAFWYKNMRSPKSLRKHWDRLHVVADEALAKVPAGSKKVAILRICSECSHEWDKNRWNSLECPDCGHYNQQYLNRNGTRERGEVRQPATAGADADDEVVPADLGRLDELLERAAPGPGPALKVHQGGKHGQDRETQAQGRGCSAGVV